MFLNLLAGGTTLAAQVAAILRKYGTDAHVYLPGIGVINGLTAGNYLDSAGTTPATVDNPVGLVLDGAGNSIARRNLLTYTEQFDNVVWSKTNSSISQNSVNSPVGTLTADTLIRGAGTTNEAMCRFTTAQAVNNTYTISVYAKEGSAGALLYLRNIAVDSSTTTGIVCFALDGTNTITAGSTYTGKASITNVGNGWYRCSITGVTGATISNNLLDIGCSTNAGLVTGSAGANIYIWGAQLEVGSSASTYQQIVAGTGEWATGIHAIQATTANKPILRRGAVNLLTYSEQFDNAAWQKTGVIVTQNAVTAPNGTLTADLLAIDSGSDFVLQNVAVTSGVTYTISAYVKADVSTNIRLLIDSGTSGNVSADLPVTTEWTRISFTGVCTVSGSRTFGIRGASTLPSSIYIWGAQLQTGSTATDYVATTTAAASSPTGNYWWQFADSTDVLSATFPAGYESATIINTAKTGQVTNTAQNIVGTYQIAGAVIGSERVTNGDFSGGSTGWVAGENITITGGESVWSATTNSGLIQNGTVQSSKFYKITYEIKSYTSGHVRFGFIGGTAVLGTVRSSAGIFTEYLNSGNNPNFYLLASFGLGFTGTIDNISIKEVAPEEYAHFIFRTGLTAGELATMQQFANTLAGV